MLVATLRAIGRRFRAEVYSRDEERGQENNDYSRSDSKPKPQMVHKSSNGYPSYTTGGVVW